MVKSKEKNAIVRHVNEMSEKITRVLFGYPLDVDEAVLERSNIQSPDPERVKYIKGQLESRGYTSSTLKYLSRATDDADNGRLYFSDYPKTCISLAVDFQRDTPVTDEHIDLILKFWEEQVYVHAEKNMNYLLEVAEYYSKRPNEEGIDLPILDAKDYARAGNVKFPKEKIREIRRQRRATIRNNNRGLLSKLFWRTND